MNRLRSRKFMTAFHDLFDDFRGLQGESVKGVVMVNGKAKKFCRGSRVNGEGVGNGDCRVSLRHDGWVGGWVDGWIDRCKI